MTSEIEIVFAEDRRGVRGVGCMSGEDPHRTTRLPEDEHYLGPARRAAP